MQKFIKFCLKPEAVGISLTLMLTVSFVLSLHFAGIVTFDAINTVLSIIEMIMAVHLVRCTSSVYQTHVWKNVSFLVLWAIPVFNLLVTAAQLIWNGIDIFRTNLFMFVLTFLSLPSFFCFYFIHVAVMLLKGKVKKIAVTVLSCLAVLCIALRAADKIILPMCLGICSGNSVIAEIFSLGKYLSCAVYLMSFVLFVVIAKTHLFEKAATKE